VVSRHAGGNRRDGRRAGGRTRIVRLTADGTRSLSCRELFA